LLVQKPWENICATNFTTIAVSAGRGEALCDRGKSLKRDQANWHEALELGVRAASRSLLAIMSKEVDSRARLGAVVVSRVRL
jgi:hypothetical protein